MSTSSAVRVVVADDSALMRNIVTRSLTRAGIEVVGSARDGDEALALCESERPDAMTLDLTMPGLDGLGVLRILRERSDTNIPVVVVSAFSAAHGARAVDALAEGAFDLVSKPTASESLEAFIDALGTKVRQAAASRHKSRPVSGGPLSGGPLSGGPLSGTTDATAPARRVPWADLPPAPPPWRSRTASKVSRLVVIATSTGGPRALASLVPKLPAPLGLGTLIVQHMPAGFTGSLATRLNASSALNVIEAAGGETLDPRTALLAPGGLHLRLTGDGRGAVLSDEPPVGGLRPRADLLIQDAARAYRDRLLLVVLTGMGNDGLAGAREVRRNGGRILVESEESCTVYGMPRAIVDSGLADEVHDLGRLAEMIATEAQA